MESWLAPEEVNHCPKEPRCAPVDHSNDKAKRYQDFNEAQNDLTKEKPPGWPRLTILVVELSVVFFSGVDATSSLP